MALIKSEGDTHTFAPDPMFNPTDEQQDRFPLEDWKYEVANGDTEQGYHDWLESKLDEEAFDLSMKGRIQG